MADINEITVGGNTYNIGLKNSSTPVVAGITCNGKLSCSDTITANSITLSNIKNAELIKTDSNGVLTSGSLPTLSRYILSFSITNARVKTTSGGLAAANSTQTTSNTVNFSIEYYTETEETKTALDSIIGTFDSTQGENRTDLSEKLYSIFRGRWYPIAAETATWQSAISYNPEPSLYKDMSSDGSLKYLVVVHNQNIRPFIYAYISVYRTDADGMLSSVDENTNYSLFIIVPKSTTSTSSSGVTTRTSYSSKVTITRIS